MSFKPQSAKERIILSLDVSNIEEASQIVNETIGKVGVYKLGLELQFAEGGLDYVKTLVDLDQNVFLDVKLLDIDNTIERAVENIAKLGVRFATIHAYPKTMEAVVRGLNGNTELCLLGVTVLTSMNEDDIKKAGYHGSLERLVKDRYLNARDAGLGGIVCSPNEVKKLKEYQDSQMVFVTPGIRPNGCSVNDQKRFATPYQAIMNGSDYLVIGRPITQSDDMAGTALQIESDIERALNELQELQELQSKTSIVNYNNNNNKTDKIFDSEQMVAAV